MRFSTAFQFPLPVPRAVRPASPGGEPGTPAAGAVEPSRWVQDLPEDLDARVRLVGEWQLGEG